MSELLVDPVFFAAQRGVTYDPEDTFAALALEGAGDRARRYCNQLFDLVIEDEVWLDGTGRDGLLLPQLPVHEVLSVQVDGTDLEESDWDPDAEVSGMIAVDAGILWRIPAPAVWSKGHSNVFVVYTHGYHLDRSTPSSYPTLPADLALAICSIAARTMTQVGVSGTVTAETIGSYSVQYAESNQSGDGLAVGERDVLDSYRVMTRPW